MGLRALRAEAPRGAPGRDPAAARESAEEVARRTSELLGEQGWCLWQCDVLDGDIIIVVDEAARDVPEGHAVYTARELFLLLEVDDTTIRLIHEAKKLGGVVILGGVEPDSGGEAVS